MSVVFHVKLLNILGFVHLPEKSQTNILKLKEFFLTLLHVHVVCFFGGEGGICVRFLTSQFNN